MPERYERLLRGVCVILAILLVLRFGWVVLNHNPLAHLKIPEVPTLANKDSTSTGKATNMVASAGKSDTNRVKGGQLNQETNSIADRGPKGATNGAADLSSQTSNYTAVARGPVVNAATNALTGTNSVLLTNATAVEQAEKGASNGPPLAVRAGTNAAGSGPA